MTSTTIVVGWLGMISIVVAPIFVLMNLFRYLGSLGMPAVPADAKVPVASPAVMAKFSPHAAEIFKRVSAKEEINDLARAMAPKFGLTPGEIIKCVATLIEQARVQQQQNRPTGGFPVITIEQSKAIPVASIAPPLAQPEEISPPPAQQKPQIGLGA